MRNPDWRQIGDRISDTVGRALRSREFREIQGTIQNTVQEIQSVFQREFGGSGVPAPAPAGGGTAQPAEVPAARPDIRNPSAGIRGDRVRRHRADRADIQYPGAGCRPHVALFGGGDRGFPPLLAVFGGMMLGGGALRRRAQRYRRYREELGNSAFCPVGVLAAAVGKSPRFVARDLRRMIGRGLFPGAHVDDEGTCLMLDDETYRYYLAARQKKNEEAERKKKTESGPPEAADEAGNVIAEGRRLLDRIRACNDDIPGEEISQKLDRLEEVAAAIFAYVEERPEKLPEIRRFLNYYLPTTLRLLEAYQSFSGSRFRGGGSMKPVPRSRTRWIRWSKHFPFAGRPDAGGCAGCIRRYGGDEVPDGTGRLDRRVFKIGILGRACLPCIRIRKSPPAHSCAVKSHSIRPCRRFLQECLPYSAR